MPPTADSSTLPKLNAIYDTVEQNPGLGATAIGRLLGIKPSAIRSYLLAMEGAGLFLYESGRGKLFVFSKGDLCPINNEPSTMTKPERPRLEIG